MKQLLLLPLLSLIFAFNLSAQNNVGIGTTTPNSTAQLHVHSASKGFLITGDDFGDDTIPSLGTGSRMMFYPRRSAFRAGYALIDSWDNSKVGQFSAAMGINVKAPGFAATGFGSGGFASGFAATVLGIATTARGDGATACGFSSNALGEYSFATGAGATAWGANSFAVGQSTRAYGYATTAIGMYNNALLPEGELSPTPTTPLFIIGNGDDYDKRSNALLVRKDGKVGIGTNTPSEQLSVVGNITATGTILSSSDIRYKTNLTSIEGALAAVLQLHPIYYHWKKVYKDKGFSGERQLGFSAQEVEGLFPEIVQTDKDGYKAVDYSRMTPVLVQALKELKAENDAMRTKLDALQRQNEELKARLDRIEGLLRAKND